MLPHFLNGLFSKQRFFQTNKRLKREQQQLQTSPSQDFQSPDAPTLFFATVTKSKIEVFFLLLMPLLLLLSARPPQVNAESNSSRGSGQSVTAKSASAAREEEKEKKSTFLANINGEQTNLSPAQASGNNEIDHYFSDFAVSQKKHKLAHAASIVKIYAPQSIVWKVLVDFEHYPEMFKRIDSCHITKRENGLIFAESYLKPQMFVKKLCQHTVTDVSQGPSYLRWKMLDGNFKSVVGTWDLTPSTGTAEHPQMCVAKYTLWADPGPVIPAPLVSFALHTVEHEVITNFKRSCEHEYEYEKSLGRQTSNK
jgi:ribosome-associated toxin RatA of RatAB toxin-antitoxin module